MRRTALLSAAFLAASSLTLATAPTASAEVRTINAPGAIAPLDEANASNDVNVSGLGGGITDINVTLQDVSHGFPSDFDIYLVSPADTAVLLLSDNCGSFDIAAIDLTFDDEAPGTMPAPCVSGTYRPTNLTSPTPDSVPGGATAAAALSAFDGQNPNGDWRVVAYDDAPGDTGTVAGGFTITITTGPAAIVVPANLSDDSGPGTPYPYPINIGLPGNVTDVNLVLSGLSHTFPEDLDVVLVNPAGAKTIVLSDACDSVDVTNVTWTFDDSAATGLPANTATPCASGTWRPTDHEPLDSMPAPSPAAPFGTSLSALNGSPAAGTWRLYVADDQGGDGGYITGVQLQVATDAPPETTITAKPKKSTTKRKAKIAFTSTVYGTNKAVGYQCKVNKSKWKACSSPLKVKKLTVGKHKVRVRAVDAAGRVDPTPAVVKWRVRR